MRFRRPAALLLSALTLSLVGGLVPAGAAATAGPPQDFIAGSAGLSQPVYPDVVTDVFDVPSFDGTEIYVEVTRPDPATYPGERFPVIAEFSPYHGTISDRKGTRIFPGPVDPETGEKLGLTGYFAPRGYAVAMVDLRGTGRSAGCLDQLGPNDARDMEVVIEWLADQEWSTGRVGTAGHSYVGASQIVAAAQRPRGLVTIVPSAGLASMYDHQFQMGVPYNLQYIGPMVAYESLALWADTPSQVPTGSLPAVGGPSGDAFGRNPESTGCGLPQTAALAGPGEVTGEYEQWHAERDWRDLAADVDIPIFMVHGVNDNAARIPAAEWFFGRRFNRPGDKVWIGQWDHGSAASTNCEASRASGGHPNCRFDQWTYALQAWFDKQLQGRDVDTGPAVEAFLNDVDGDEETPANVATMGSWSRPALTNLYLDANDRSLSFDRPTEAGSATFTAQRLTGAANSGGDGIVFDSAPLEEDAVFVGLPQLELRMSMAVPLQHLVATLTRIDEGGTETPLTTCAMSPALRNGIAAYSPVVPGQEMTLRPQCFTMASEVVAGDVLRLTVVDNSDAPGPPGSHHVSTQVGQATIFTGPSRPAGIGVPLREGQVTYPDVPLLAAAED